MIGAMLAGALLLLTPREANAHASLVSSDPKPGSLLRSSPRQVRLVFSEATDAALDRINVIDRDEHQLVLHVERDPHDVHAVVAPLEQLANGTYRVVWRVVSVDGHLVGGSFVFTVGEAPADTGAAGASIPDVAAPVATAVGPLVAGAPLLAAAVRAAAVGSLMVLVGILVFARASRLRPTHRVNRFVDWLALSALALCIAHTLLWLADTAPGNEIDATWAQAALSSYTGLAELARCALALLVVWALLLARRPSVALVFAAAALVASSVIGHASAMHPAWAIPAKTIHLFAASAWIGGLSWLLLLDRSGSADNLREVQRVSGVALAAVATVALTGALETLLVTPSARLLLSSAYGALVLTKIVGVAVLIGFGAYHRHRAIPAVREGRPIGVLQRSVAREMAVMILVVLLGGWLAYVPPPMPNSSPATASSTLESLR